MGHTSILLECKTLSQRYDYYGPLTDGAYHKDFSLNRCQGIVKLCQRHWESWLTRSDFRTFYSCSHWTSWTSLTTTTWLNPNARYFLELLDLGALYSNLRSCLRSITVRPKKPLGHNGSNRKSLEQSSNLSRLVSFVSNIATYGKEDFIHSCGLSLRRLLHDSVLPLTSKHNGTLERAANDRHMT